MLADVLRDPRIGGFDVQQVFDADERTVRRHLASFFADRHRDDLLYVHFSCHGLKDRQGRLYLAAADTELRSLGATAVPASFVAEQMSETGSGRVVLVLDCCYSSAFARGAAMRGDRTVHVAEEFGGGTGRIVLTASSATEYAFEGDQLTHEEARPSVFTSALVAGLRSGEADLDGDGEISIDELYDFAYQHVREARSDQQPMKWSFGMAGSLVVARSVRPAVLPEQIRTDLSSDRVVLRMEAVAALGALLAGGRPGLRNAARTALAELREHDDSARVRGAASDVLSDSAPPVPRARPEPLPAATSPALAPPSPAPVSAKPVSAEPVSAAPVPAAPMSPAPVSVAPTSPTPLSPPPQAPVPSSPIPLSPPPETPVRIAARAAVPSPAIASATKERGPSSTCAPDPTAMRWFRLAGLLAVAGALTWFVGASQDEETPSRKAYAANVFGADHVMFLALIAVAAALLWAPWRWRAVTAAGLVGGAAWYGQRAASLIADVVIEDRYYLSVVGAGWTLDLLSDLAIVAAAGVAAFGLSRVASWRTGFSVPLVAVAASAGGFVAVAAALQHTSGGSPADVFVVALAMATADFAVMIASRRLGAAVLVGSVAAGALRLIGWLLQL